MDRAEARSQPPGAVLAAQAPPPCQENQRRRRAGALAQGQLAVISSQGVAKMGRARVVGPVDGS
jgi:hypothetical protein